MKRVNQSISLYSLGLILVGKIHETESFQTEYLSQIKENQMLDEIKQIELNNSNISDQFKKIFNENLPSTQRPFIACICEIDQDFSQFEILAHIITEKRSFKVIPIIKIANFNMLPSYFIDLLLANVSEFLVGEVDDKTDSLLKERLAGY